MHTFGVPCGKLTPVNVVVPVPPGTTVICVPVIGDPPAIVIVGVNVPLLPPEFAHVTIIFTIVGQLCEHVAKHPLMQGIPPTVIF